MLIPNIFQKLVHLNHFYVMGIFFAIAQLFIFSAVVNDPATTMFLLWSCNNFCIFLIYACYKKDMQMIMGISYLGLISQILWVSDFGSQVFGFNLSGIADYIYLEGFTYTNQVSIGVHVIIPLTILIFSFKTKPAFRSFVYAFPYIVFIYVATILWTPPVEDINCVFLGCGNGQYIPYNIYLWPLYALISTVLSYGIHSLLYYGWRKIIVYVRHFSAHKHPQTR